MSPSPEIILDRLIAYVAVEARLGYLADEYHELDGFFLAEAYGFARAALKDEIAKLRTRMIAKPAPANDPADAV